MSTQTTHYGLTKPDTTDAASISAINGNMDILDGALNDLSEAIAIIQRTDTATQDIEQGTLVIWKGDLCKANSAITSGDTLSSTNLTAVTDGGLNRDLPAALRNVPYSFTYNVPKNSSNFYYKNITSLFNEGEKCYGIVGYSTNSSNVALVCCKTLGVLSNYQLFVELRNLSSSAIESTFRVQLLIG